MRTDPFHYYALMPARDDALLACRCNISAAQLNAWHRSELTAGQFAVESVQPLAGCAADAIAVYCGDDRLGTAVSERVLRILEASIPDVRERAVFITDGLAAGQRSSRAFGLPNPVVTTAFVETHSRRGRPRQVECLSRAFVHSECPMARLQMTDVGSLVIVHRTVRDRLHEAGPYELSCEGITDEVMLQG
jgi:hypothetical protein